MGIIKRIKLPSLATAYDIGAKYDVDGNEIKDTYATKTDLANEVDGKQDKLTFDTTPKEGSSNPVTSDGVKSYIDERALVECSKEDINNLFTV